MERERLILFTLQWSSYLAFPFDILVLEEKVSLHSGYLGKESHLEYKTSYDNYYHKECVNIILVGIPRVPISQRTTP